MEEKINELLDEYAYENDAQVEEIQLALITFALDKFPMEDFKAEVTGDSLEEQVEHFMEYYGSVSDLFSYIDTDEAEVLLGLTERFIKRAKSGFTFLSAGDFLE